jgi:RNA polymerase subunit RPABC4/transcription elongation factor Spt4
MTDLERFFGQLVRNLAARDRSRLEHPVPLAEVRSSIVPYRANRKALQLESSEDYELVLMRLCAGEGRFVIIEPAESRVAFEMEVGTPYPDLTLMERHEKAVLHLDPKAVSKVLNPAPDLAYAPPEPPSALNSGRQRSKATKNGSPVDQRPDVASQCPRCKAGLPTDRPVNFCPQCGQSLARRRCARCQAELEPEWRHCVSCGSAIG